MCMDETMMERERERRGRRAMFTGGWVRGWRASGASKLLVK